MAEFDHSQFSRNALLLPGSDRLTDMGDYPSQAGAVGDRLHKPGYANKAPHTDYTSRATNGNNPLAVRQSAY